MEIVIKIDDERYKDIQRIAEVQLDRSRFQTAEQIIANGTPLPKGHGDLKDANELKKAIDYAVEFMEQESVLDKVRNEIAEYGSIWVAYAITGHSDRDIENLIEGVLKQAKEQVLNIIDKYRTESEV